jgi:hypothetical protein
VPVAAREEEAAAATVACLLFDTAMLSVGGSVQRFRLWRSGAAPRRSLGALFKMGISPSPRQREFFVVRPLVKLTV